MFLSQNQNYIIIIYSKVDDIMNKQQKIIVNIVGITISSGNGTQFNPYVVE